MTTTETDTPAEETPDPPAAEESGTAAPGDDSTEGPPEEPPALEAGGPTRNEPLWTRGILPLALPFLAALAMAIWVINLSRAFIAGGSDGALVIVMVITLTIMAGAALMSAASRLRTGSSVMLVAALLMVVVTAGIITLGPSENEGGEAGPAYKPPKGPVVATLKVIGGPGTKFDEKEYTLGPPGITEVVFTGKESHTLVFDDAKFAGLILHTPGTDKSKVELEPGEYTIYCTLPGHRAGGMEATITVEAAPSEPAPTPTTSPASS